MESTTFLRILFCTVKYAIFKCTRIGRFDCVKGVISEAACHRQVMGVSALRAFAENVKCCRWQEFRRHWGEGDGETCGNCDICEQLANDPDPLPVQLGDVTMLLLLMVDAATKGRTPADMRSESWNKIKLSSMRPPAVSNAMLTAVATHA